MWFDIFDKLENSKLIRDLKNENSAKLSKKQGYYFRRAAKTGIGDIHKV